MISFPVFRGINASNAASSYLLVGVIIPFIITGSRGATIELTEITGLAICTKNATGQTRMLEYPDGSLHPIKIPFAVWASAQIVSQIAHILLSEVMGYRVVLLENAGKDSGQPASYAAGCVDASTTPCTQYDISRPMVHFTVETWQYGIGVALALPADIQPALISVLDYNTFEATYLWASVLEDGSAQKLSLDYFKSYDANLAQPHRFFDHWRRIQELIPEKYAVRCADMTAKSINDRDVANYIRVMRGGGGETRVGRER
jgi:hypothetical protein